MKTFKERLELLDKALSRETPESLFEKLQSYGNADYSFEDMMDDIPEICWQTCHWNNDQKVQRTIVCAANRFKLKGGGTLVIPGARHYSKDMAEVLDVVGPQLVSQQVCGDDQGFIDQYSNYWTREEAMVIATYAGQVRIERGGSEKELYSEDLY
ncbi:anti-restriction nuclease [Septuagintavirus sv54]|uniref:Anti-restriction nuclease n=1 Tax=Escherichia phage A5-4 TaxID=2996162 RepID=A0AAE9Q291_9CAUD|nr:anti-restriction nuclease [Escherichia phage A5-4]